MTKWKIYDNKTTELPAFELAWLPTKAYQYVTPLVKEWHRGASQVYLKSGPHVGTIPLLSGETLYILPRAGQESFSRMVLLTEGLGDAIQEEFESFASLGYQDPEEIHWLELLARPFIDQLREIERRSLMPLRNRVRDKLWYARGAVNPFATILRITQRRDNPVLCSYREKTYDTPENRTLASAAVTLLHSVTVDDRDREVAARWSRKIGGKKIDTDILSQVVRGLQSHRYAGARSYYIPALVMARLILAQGGVSLWDKKLKYVESEPILINMPLLFEEYIRIVISNFLSNQGYVVEKNENRPPHLFLDGTCELIPDIIVSKNNSVCLVADVKYKPRWKVESEDYYQIKSYMDALGVTSGLLLLPSGEKGESDFRQHRTVDDGIVYELFLPLDDWRLTEDFVGECLETILG